MTFQATPTTESKPDQVQTDCIRIRGASTHNLKQVDIDIPHDQLIVITGVSGSGKSSLAFDTIFAEGRRQFIESQSVYTRQFISQLPRAEVELIDGLPPTLAIDQRPSQENPRSTVGTITEIYDYLRVLLARFGEVRCHQCGQPIRQQSLEQIRDRLTELPEGTKLMVMAPMVRDRRGAQAAVFEKIRSECLVRVRVNGEVLDIESVPELSPSASHTIEAVTDRIVIREGIESRLFESLELATRLGEGACLIAHMDADRQWHDTTYSTQYACPDCNISYAEVEPRSFSFNSPHGACETCSGVGILEGFDGERVLDSSRSLNGGAVKCWEDLTTRAREKRLKELSPLLKELQQDINTPLVRWDEESLGRLWTGTETNSVGILMLLRKELSTETNPERLELLEALQSNVDCVACKGSRLKPQANSVFLNGLTIASITALPIDEAIHFFESLTFDDHRSELAKPLFTEILGRLRFLQKVGVGYLSLDRRGSSISGGEHQRVRLATAIGTGLTNVCFVLDEPSIGLHPRDNARLISTIRDLQKSGNTVIVVEHDDEIMRVADFLIDVGPQAGKRGGEIVAAGTPDEVMQCEASLTGQYLAGKKTLRDSKTVARPREIDPGRVIELRGASGFNLQNVDVTIPLGVFCCVTGVSGSGKSTLINRTLAPAIREHLGLLVKESSPYESVSGLELIDRLVQVDQRPIGRTSRGCAATATGVWAEVRKIFAATKEAKRLGYTASRFSFNSKAGHCGACQGHGQRRIKMNFLPDLFVTCPICNGRRFNQQTLQVRFRGMTIAEVLNAPVERALVEFENIEKISTVLQCLSDVGLGYLSLGQPSSTLSGGEAQRVKLAAELARKSQGHTVYLLDEPTTGLHFEDVRRLLNVISQLVEKGNTVIVIEHNLDVIKSSDWVIDVGPEGGEAGGQIVATGTVQEVASNPQSHTGQALRDV